MTVIVHQPENEWAPTIFAAIYSRDRVERNAEKLKWRFKKPLSVITFIWALEIFFGVREMNEDISGAPQFSLSSSASWQFGRSSFLQPLELLFSLDLVRRQTSQTEKKIHTNTHANERPKYYGFPKQFASICVILCVAWLLRLSTRLPLPVGVECVLCSCLNVVYGTLRHTKWKEWNNIHFCCGRNSCLACSSSQLKRIHLASFDAQPNWQYVRINAQWRNWEKCIMKLLRPGMCVRVCVRFSSKKTTKN